MGNAGIGHGALNSEQGVIEFISPILNSFAEKSNPLNEWLKGVPSCWVALWSALVSSILAGPMDKMDKMDKTTVELKYVEAGKTEDQMIAGSAVCVGLITWLITWLMRVIRVE